MMEMSLSKAKTALCRGPLTATTSSISDRNGSNRRPRLAVLEMLMNGFVCGPAFFHLTPDDTFDDTQNK
jgi:hypothetical protein